MAELIIDAGSAGKTCPYCRFPLKGGIAAVACDSCGTVHHPECWHEGEGCAVFGCRTSGIPSSPPIAEPQRVSAARPVPLPAFETEATPNTARRPGRPVVAAVAATLLLGALGAAVVVSFAPFGAATPKTPPAIGPAPSEGDFNGHVAQAVQPLIGPQKRLSVVVAASQASAASFAALREAANTLQESLFRAQGAASVLVSLNAAQRAGVVALQKALSAQASYARSLAGLPAPSNFTPSQALFISARATAAQNAYGALLREVAPPCCAAMPITGTSQLISVANAVIRRRAVSTQPTTPALPPGALGDWPGESGYTAILASVASESAARTIQSQAAANGLDAGVLDSSNFRSLRPGYWVVFSGTFTTLSDAARRTGQAKALGYVDAYPRFVSTTPPVSVPTQASTVSPPGPSGRLYLVTNNVIIRDGPSTSANEIGRIPAGAQVGVQCKALGETINGRWGPDPNWNRVTYNGTTGYVTDEWIDTQQDEVDPSKVPPC